MKRFLNFLAILLLAVNLFPVGSYAYDRDEDPNLGTITIDVIDQDGNEIGGAWFLHQGSGDQGLIVRNGTKGETFKKNNGFYFIRAHNIKNYEARVIKGENPQNLFAGETVHFTVQYFETAEDLVKAEAKKDEASSQPTESTETQEIKKAEDSADKEVIEVQPTSSGVIENKITIPKIEEVKVPEVKKAITPEVKTPTPTEYVYAKPFDTAPETATNTGETPTPRPFQLAKTGQSANAILLLMATMSSFFLIRKQKTN